MSSDKSHPNLVRIPVCMICHLFCCVVPHGAGVIYYCRNCQRGTEIDAINYLEHHQHYYKNLEEKYERVRQQYGI